MVVTRLFWLWCDNTSTQNYPDLTEHDMPRMQLPLSARSTIPSKHNRTPCRKHGVSAVDPHMLRSSLIYSTWLFFAISELGRWVMSGLAMPPGGSYQGALAHPPTALRLVLPQRGSPSWGKGLLTASSSLQRVLRREVALVRPRAHIPLLVADDTGGRVPWHPVINLRTMGSKGRSLSCSPPPGLVLRGGERT